MSWRRPWARPGRQTDKPVLLSRAKICLTLGPGQRPDVGMGVIGPVTRPDAVTPGVGQFGDLNAASRRLAPPKAPSGRRSLNRPE